MYYMDDGSGVYFYNRRNVRRRSHRLAAVLVTTLFILTAAICLLVVFLPKLSPSSDAAAASGFGGKTFYALATAEETERLRADEQAKSAAERGGAGLVYNDGSYRVIAALYSREADAKTLASVNSDCHYFALAVPAYACGSGDKKLLEYLTGEWFDTLYTAANELDRGNTTDSSAQHAVDKANARLLALSFGAENAALGHCVQNALEYSEGQRSVVSAIRSLQSRAVIAARTVLG